MLAGLLPRYSLVLNTSEYLVSMTIHRRRRDRLLWTVSLPQAFLVLTILARLPLRSATPVYRHRQDTCVSFMDSIVPMGSSP